MAAFSDGRDPSSISGFEDVDRAPDPAALLAYLDTASALRSVQDYKRQSFALLDPRPGSRVLDVGSGTGDDVRLLAALVGPEGRVVGLDSSEAAVAEARRRSEVGGLPVEFQVGDAHELPFPGDAFDAARSDRVLQHLRDPARALAELIRVTRPGGTVVVMDSDWDTLVVDSPELAVTRQIVHAHANSTLNGQIGRQLRALFVAAGLEDVRVVPVAAALTSFPLANQVLRLAAAARGAVATGAVSEEQAERWLAQLEEADRDGRFFTSLTGYIVAGRKPNQA
jgi:ubiquinone/menaquinone biosynthesis C-methylase UbiE